ncbi:MFS transporter [Candidatus Bipolaricaulota bacterium]|nr:MFS transporter [Candidatus Bipolaricaulota bacterium]MBS3793145.1 MFS transporter [Candidatus Bipolaricaulota bacterium]
MEDKAESERTNFIGGVIHGTFLRSSSRLADIDLILPAFVSSITGSKFLIALLPSIYFSTGRLPQILFSNYVEPRSRKKPFLYIAILTRALIWFLFGFFVTWRGLSDPGLTLLLLFVFLLIYSLAGSLGGVAYTAIIGKAISEDRRARFYATRQVTGSLLAFGMGSVVRFVLGEGFYFGFPRNYGVLFLLSGMALLIGFVGFWMISEPEMEEGKRKPLSSYFSNVMGIVKKDRKLRLFLLTRVLAGFHIMIIPYYVVYFKEVAGVAESFIGIYLMARVFGGAVSNFLWGRVAERAPEEVILLCLLIAGITPLVALGIINYNPIYYSAVFVLAGSAINARMVGFNTHLLELAPEEKRATYSGIRGTTIALTAPLPFLAGGLIEFFSFKFAFIFVSAMMLLGVGINLIHYGFRFWGKK